MRPVLRHALRRAAAGAAVSLASAFPAGAGTTVFTDPYGAGAPDVLASSTDFDIQTLSLTLSPQKLAIDLRLNYHAGDTTLAAFTEPGTSYASVPLQMGDVLIQGRSFLWAIPLPPLSSGGIGGGIGYALMGPVRVDEPLTRGSLIPGSIYKATGTLSAGQVLGVGAGSDLRADEAVWGTGNRIGSGGPDYTGYPIVTSLGGPELDIALQNTINATFYDDVNGHYHVHFASSTCACDVLDGSVPEPSGLALWALGALALLLRHMNDFTAR